jgi:folate-binding protein YgfZ
MESQGKTTHNPMYPHWNLLPIESLGALRARGRDVVSFLQGQLSCDLTLLTAERSLLAGYHNPQGRVLALLRVLELAPGEVLLILPRELVGPLAQRLAGYILRSKVTLRDESSAWRIEALVGPGARELPMEPGGVTRRGQTLAARVGEHPARWLIVAPATPSSGQPDFNLSPCEVATEELWRRLAVENAEPQVYAATSGEFVAQMLNLDALGAIAFDKGCYTGQEVIARAHYRGRVKRRLQRFQTVGPATLQPGDAGRLPDGRAFRVVDAVKLPEGGCQFLAVAPLAAAGPSAEEAPGAAGARRVNAIQLSLPYALPEDPR